VTRDTVRKHAQVLFEEGRSLVDENAGDSTGAKKEALELGVARLEEALREGLPDRASALAALWDGYSGVLAFPGTSGEGRRAIENRVREVLRELSELRPENEGFVTSYVEVVEDPAVRIRILEERTGRFPGQVETRLVLSRELCSVGRRDDAYKHLLAAADALSPEDPIPGFRIVAAADQCLEEARRARISAAVAAKVQLTPP